MFCTRCGHRNPVGSRFCASCGQQLIAETDDRTVPIGDVASGSGLFLGDPTEAAAVADEVGYMLVTSGHRSGARFVICGEVTTAGRHPESDIFLDDITVSRRHVEIRSVDGGLIIADAGSLNGTYLNGVRIDSAALNEGDEVQIGKFKLLYLVEEG